MKNIHATKIQCITLLIAMLFGIQLTTTSVFAQDSYAAVKIQLLSEALTARENGEWLVAKEKVETLVEMAPDDTNIQALLISINQKIKDKGIVVPNNIRKVVNNEEKDIQEVDAEEKPSKSFFQKINRSNLLPAEEVSPKYVAQKEIVNNLLLVAKSQIAIGDLAGATSTLHEIEARDSNNKDAKHYQ